MYLVVSIYWVKKLTLWKEYDFEANEWIEVAGLLLLER
jgi:hypothetical protein